MQEKGQMKHQTLSCMGILVKEESLKEVDNQHCDTRYLGLEIQVFAEPAHNLTLSNFLIFFFIFPVPNQICFVAQGPGQ